MKSITFERDSNLGVIIIQFGTVRYSLLLYARLDFLLIKIDSIFYQKILVYNLSSMGAGLSLAGYRQIEKKCPLNHELINTYSISPCMHARTHTS